MTNWFDQITNDKLGLITKELLSKMALDIHPSRLIPEHIALNNNKLLIDNESFDLTNKNIYVIGCGKASISMSEAIEKTVSNIKDGLVVAPEGLPSNTKKIKVIYSTHPLVSEKSFEAGKSMINFVDNIPKDSMIICLLSGGGSALLAHPVEGLEAKKKLDYLNLLISKVFGESGIEVNIIRKALSGLKGGKLARRIKDRQIINLLLLDNRGDISAIASGPTILPNREKTAKQILEEYNYYSQTPENIRKIIDEDAKLKFNEKEFKIKNVLLADNNMPRKSLEKHSKAYNFKNVWIIDGYYDKDIEQTADELARKYEQIYNNTSEKGRYMVVAGGELPITPKGNGNGGRNQHLAAIMMQKLSNLKNFAFASYATDGKDFLEGIHGALFTDKTINIIKQKNININSYIGAYDTYHLHKELNTLIEGPLSGTNLSDIYLFVFKK